MLYWCRHAVLVFLLAPMIAQGLALENDSYPLAHQGLIWQDPKGEVSFADIQLNPVQIPWQMDYQGRRSLGFTEDAFWVRIPLDRPSWKGSNWVLVAHYALLDSVQIYLTDQNGQLIAQSETGRSQPHSSRELSHRSLALPIELPTGPSILYVRLASESALKPRLSLQTASAFAEYAERRAISSGLLYGALAVAVLMYLVFGLTLKIWPLIPIGGYFLIGGLWQSVLEGSLGLLWPAHTAVPPATVPMLLWVMAACVQTYAWILQRERGRSFRARDGVIAGCLVAGLMLSWLLPYSAATRVAIFGNFLVWCGLGAQALLSDHDNWRRRMAILASAGIYMAGAGLLALDTLGVTAFGDWSSVLYVVTSMPQVVLLTFGAVLFARQQSLQNSRAQEDLMAQIELAASAQAKTYQAEKQFASEVKQMRAELTAIRDQAERDPLTGLANRASLEHYLKALSRQPMSQVSCVFIDLDYFKRLNDNYGHAIGDEALVAVAEVLAQQATRQEDFVGRFGGEEFVIVLPRTGLVEAELVAERLLQHIRQISLFAGELPVRFSASAGIATHIDYRDGALDFEKLFEAADKALYNAKAKGRDQVSVVPQQVGLVSA